MIRWRQWAKGTTARGQKEQCQDVSEHDSNLIWKIFLSFSGLFYVVLSDSIFKL